MRFLTTTLKGGLLVLLPLLLFYLFADEVLGLIVTLAGPIAELVAPGALQEAEYPTLLAALLLLGATFLMGLAVRSSIARRLGRWLEHRLLDPLPAYGVFKSLTLAFVGVEEAGAFQPALLLGSEGKRELAYVIEEHGDGQLTLLLPWSPATFAGSVVIVPRSSVELLQTGLGDFTRVLGNMGAGTRDLLATGSTPYGQGPAAGAAP